MHLSKMTAALLEDLDYIVDPTAVSVFNCVDSVALAHVQTVENGGVLESTPRYVSAGLPAAIEVHGIIHSFNSVVIRT